MKTTAVIMAGGRGERLWPLSRAKLPKQFLALASDDRSLLQQAAGRASLFAAAEDTFVVTCAEYECLVREHLPQIPAANILTEPAPRGTAPCVGLAAAVIGRLYGDALMVVMPSDHLIEDEGLYAETVSGALAKAADGDSIVTIGITPTHPETGYGYILCGPTNGRPLDPLPVLRFVEKPDAETARRFVLSGDYLWNSGIFVFKASSIMTRIDRLLPGLACGLAEIAVAWGTPRQWEALARRYGAFDSVSVDRGILERTGGIWAVRGGFGWDDAGGLAVFGRILPGDGNGNAHTGSVALHGVGDSIVVGGGRLIAAVGVHGLVIVDAGDALLVCAKDALGEVRGLLRELEQHGMDGFL